LKDRKGEQQKRRNATSLEKNQMGAGGGGAGVAVKISSKGGPGKTRIKDSSGNEGLAGLTQQRGSRLRRGWKRKMRKRDPKPGDTLGPKTHVRHRSTKRRKPPGTSQRKGGSEKEEKCSEASIGSECKAKKKSRHSSSLAGVVRLVNAPFLGN